MNTLFLRVIQEVVVLTVETLVVPQDMDGKQTRYLRY